jgi:hypothetical protein
MQRAAEKRVRSKVRRKLPRIKNLEVRLDTTFELFCNVIDLEEKRNQGKRYGNPVIDIARELNRYFHPEIHDAGRKRDTIEEIKKDLCEPLRRILEKAGLLARWS